MVARMEYTSDALHKIWDVGQLYRLKSGEVQAYLAYKKIEKTYKESFREKALALVPKASKQQLQLLDLTIEWEPMREAFLAGLIGERLR